MSTAPSPTAPLLRRLTCLIYELFLLGAVVVVFFLLPQTLLGVFAGITLLPGALLAHLFLLLLIYFGWFWLHGGQTLAMKTWRIRLVSADPTPLRPGQIVLRYMAAWPSLGLAGIGLIWAVFDPDRQFLHDRIAGTRLIILPAPPKKAAKNAAPTQF